MPAASEQVRFVADGVDLQGILDLPECADLLLPGIAVCHAHPLHGGDMFNDVVSTICRAANSRGIATLRFNFRGTGSSAGEFSGGAGEREDLWAALDYLRSRNEIDRTRLGVAGYSFGAAVALNAGIAARIRALVAVSPPPQLLDFGAMKGYEFPVLLVAGNQDPFVPVERIQQLRLALGPATETVIITGAGHFWGGYAGALTEAVASFLDGQLWPERRS